MQETQKARTKQRDSLIAFGVICLVILMGFIGSTYIWSMRMGNGQQHVIQSHRTYHLNLMGATRYPVNQPTELMFDIRDENNKVLKNFDTVHEKILHLIVVRKDRAYFQHVHPEFDAASGMFAMTGFAFPTDGEYRVFADFTASDNQTGPDGMKLSATPYQDVKVGSGMYVTQPLGSDTLTSDVDGLSTALRLISDGSSSQPYANTPLMLDVRVSKNGATYTNLQPYLGALGHMVILGPNLEFIHAHPLNEDVNSQTGPITFMVTFPGSGQYKMYLQIQSDNQVHTTDYNYTVQPNPSGTNTNTNGSMQGMEQMGH